MAGIYIHIPFCKQKCSYCNFYFSVSMKTKNELIQAILLEIDLNHSYLKTETIDTIYFGGGTPSLLTIAELERIINKLHKYYKFSEEIEITLEANPDDIDVTYLKSLKKTGVNRFSMGVQSFIDDELRVLNRYHNAQKAEYSIKLIQDNQFDNMNIDLIFGIPNSTIKSWKYNLDKFIDLDIPHLSCYNLTIEPKTAIHHQIKTGKLPEPDDDYNAKLFLETYNFLSSEGFEHYEISNYAKNKSYAKHNTNYWKGVPYLGLGPSAHSYNGDSRQWNIYNNRKYIAQINKGNLPFEKEILNPKDKFNEYLMTGLRTMWGIDINKLKSFGTKYYEAIKDKIEAYVEQGILVRQGDIYKTSLSGKLLTDRITSDLFID